MERCKKLRALESDELYAILRKFSTYCSYMRKVLQITTEATTLFSKNFAMKV